MLRASLGSPCLTLCHGYCAHRSPNSADTHPFTGGVTFADFCHVLGEPPRVCDSIFHDFCKAPGPPNWCQKSHWLRIRARPHIQMRHTMELTPVSLIPVSLGPQSTCFAPCSVYETPAKSKRCLPGCTGISLPGHRGFHPRRTCTVCDVSGAKIILPASTEQWLASPIYGKGSLASGGQQATFESGIPHSREGLGRPG
jgi:hypothetical protein